MKISLASLKRPLDYTYARKGKVRKGFKEERESGDYGTEGAYAPAP